MQLRGVWLEELGAGTEKGRVEAAVVSCLLRLARILCFNLLVRAVSILALLVGMALPAQPQNTAGTPLDNHPYLLRLQHQTSGSDTCVLLQRDGGYHLERTDEEATSVFEGSLSADELSLLNRWLDNERLRQLTKNDIAEALVPTRVDRLYVNIFRGDHWQDLVFPDGESQEPFQPSLAPLISWLDALHRASHKKLLEDIGKRNCLPPGRVELKTRPAAGAQTLAPETVGGGAQTENDAQVPRAAPPRSFVMRLEYTRLVQPEAERTCVVIYPGARYHMEKSSQELRRIRDGLFDPGIAPSGKVKTQVYEGLFYSKDLQALQLLLDDPNLKAVEKGNLSEDSLIWNTEIFRLAIFRGNHVQRLEFMDPVHFFDPGGNGIFLHDKNLRLIRPIQKWVKAEIRPSKVSLLPDATPTQCFLP